MKTNQVMIRLMSDFKVEQRTKDGFFNLTSLLKQWNNFVDNRNTLNPQNYGELKKKDLDDYLSNKSTDEFIRVIIKRECLESRCDVIKSTKGKYGGTWVHPIFFIDACMWINPYFKYDALKFVQDEMIKFRNLAGDAYPEMCKAVYSIIPERIFKEKISALAKSLNIIVYGKHENQMRNKVGDATKIKELYELQLQIAQFINLGLVKSYEQLRDVLTKMYYQKYPNVLPI